MAEDCGAYDTLVVWDEAMKRAVWAARSAFLTAIEAETRLVDEMDVVVPVDRIAEFLLYSHDAAEEEGIRLRSFGARRGREPAYLLLLQPTGGDEFKKRVKKLMDKCYAKCAEFGGQVSGEHSIGHAKKAYLRESVGERAYGLMAP